MESLCYAMRGSRDFSANHEIMEFHGFEMAARKTVGVRRARDGGINSEF